jgi:hypothetical protein
MRALGALTLRHHIGRQVVEDVIDTCVRSAAVSNKGSQSRTDCNIENGVDLGITLRVRQHFDVELVENIFHNCRDLDDVATAATLLSPLSPRQDVNVHVICNIRDHCKTVEVRGKIIT